MIRSRLLALGAALLELALAAPAVAQPVVRMPAQDQVLRVRPQPLFSVGAEDGRDWEVFGNVTSVAFDSRENLYVLDGMNARVVVFDSVGRFVRVVGRRGGGPGEIQGALGIMIAPNDELVVSDAARRGFSVFGPDGGFLRSIPYARGTLVTGQPVPHPRGGMVAEAAGNPVSRSADALGEELILWQPFAAGAAPVPLWTVRTRADRAREGPAGAPVFSPGTHFAVLPGGELALVNGVGYSIRIVGGGGAVLRVLERPIAPRQVTARDREWAARRNAERTRDVRVVAPGGATISPALRADIAQAMTAARFASRMPVIRTLAADRGGNLWVQRSGPAPGSPGSHRCRHSLRPLPGHPDRPRLPGGVQPRWPRRHRGRGRSQREARPRASCAGPVMLAILVLH